VNRAGIRALLALLLMLATGCGASTSSTDESTHAASRFSREGTAAARHFLATYVTSDGRVLRKDQGSDVVSEGQAYGMLIAELVGDDDTVRQIWSWTRDHLRRPDGLLGFHADSSGKVLDPQSATDADTLAAYALLRYDGPDGGALHADGDALAKAVLTGETARIGSGGLVPVAGSWVHGEPAAVNPSYWMPGVARSLAGLTHDDRWSTVADTTVRLTEDLTTKTTRHRLLLMLDEFPALGRLDFFESALAFMAGYGLKSFLITQSLNQIEKAYGPNNSVLDNCHVRVSFATNDERTAKRVSDALGTATEMRAMKNYAGHRLSPWLGHLMVSRQETARQLLTPGEIMQLPPTDEIVMVAGLPPIRAKKARYYEDTSFKERVLPPPELARSGEAEPDDWSQLPVLAHSEATQASGMLQQDDGDPTGSERRLQAELNRAQAVEKAAPIENEFDMEPDDDADDHDAVRNRRLARLMQGVARQVSLDPDDGMEL